MSEQTTSNENDDQGEPWPNLCDAFGAALAENGGDSGAAFVSILDELDRRMNYYDDKTAQTRHVLETTAQWLGKNHTSQLELPQDIKAMVELGTGSLSTAARRGASEGAKPAHELLTALREAQEGKRAQWRWMKRLTLLWTPVVLLGAIVAGLLFSSIVIPLLPQDWEWPCTIIGTEFRPNIDPDNPTTFCVNVRD